MRQFIVSEAEPEILAGVLLAERLSSIETNTDGKITVDVQLSIETSKEEKLEGLGENSRIPVGVIEGLLIGGPFAVEVGAVDGCPVRINQSSGVGRVSDDTVDEGFDRLPLECGLGTNGLIIVPRSQLLDNVVDERGNTVN